MRESLLRMLDYLETERDKALAEAWVNESEYWRGYWTGIASAFQYSIKDLKKVLADA